MFNTVIIIILFEERRVVNFSGKGSPLFFGGVNGERTAGKIDCGGGEIGFFGFKIAVDIALRSLKNFGNLMDNIRIVSSQFIDIVFDGINLQN